MLKTERLILRPFRETDAEDLYAYARDPRVGPIAGWPIHGSPEESREIIRTVFAAPNVFALELREIGRVIGSAGLVGRHPAGEIPDCPDDEIGYALSPDHWGRGLVPEAVEALLGYGFTELDLRRIWCGHYAGNWRSDRVIRKCGYAVDNEELEYGLVCLGVAIMDSNNKPVGGISVSGPASRMTPENRTAFAEYLIDCGRQISSKL